MIVAPILIALDEGEVRELGEEYRRLREQFTGKPLFAVYPRTASLLQDLAVLSQEED